MGSPLILTFDSRYPLFPLYRDTRNLTRALSPNTDDDNSFGELEVAWFVDEEDICPWKTASSTEDSFCDIIFAAEDTTVVAEVRDTQGADGRDEITITLTATEAPVVGY